MQSEFISRHQQSGQINGIPVQGHIHMLGSPGKAAVVYGDICIHCEEDRIRLLALDTLIYQGPCCDGEGQQTRIELPIQWSNLGQEMLSFCGLVDIEDAWVLRHVRQKN
ncbi:hypothetical protein [Deinococcus roseus]|uniref:Uncharacterized protein n=1 Tax=Deinococcus roseus TaxID=392414 RepID=A0ABQ2CWY4_9DEIO|nr:hypothetical protein [Deinococcus roseus]GGJ24199.1 hypothetical protein GCM10008938_07920 [Deinococcus roseus]